MAEPNIPPDAGERRGPSRRARKKKAQVDTRREVEFNFRGKTLEELQALPYEEMLEILPSSARRFFKRGLNHEAEQLWEKVKAADEGDEVRTHVREFPITPDFVGKTLAIHDGKEFQKITVTSEMIGHKLGEFALTRKAPSHTGPGVGATRSSKFMPLK